MTLDFTTFAKYAERIENTDSGNEKTALLADLLQDAGADVGSTARFIQGDIFPAWDDRNVSVGPALLYEALAAASNTSKSTIEDRVAETGDIGLVCDELNLSPDTGQQTLGTTTTGLTAARVYEAFEEIAATEGAGSNQEKIDAVKTLLFDGSTNEAKYIARLLLGKMRIGVGEGTVRDAIAAAFDVPVEDVKRALMVTNDVETTAETARDWNPSEDPDGGLRALSINLGRPIQPMLASKGAKQDALDDAGTGGEVVVERKFDGARLQGHKDGDDVRLFTRGMDEVTSSMPDVCDIIRDRVTATTAVIDCEVVAYETDDATEPLPFQEVMKRLRRKYDIEEKSDEIHLDIHVFDILYADGEELIDESGRDRRAHLSSVVDDSIAADQWTCSSADDIADIESSALEAGHEGVMVKDPASTYQPSNRGKNWLKIKPDVETFDCVVVGGEWGEGRRAQWIGAFLLAVRDEETGEFKPIGKVATGVTDEQLADLTERFEPLIESEDGKDITFQPSVVFEVGAEEIQPSPTYESGYGLRFPRFLTVREDKGIEDADTVQRVENLYDAQ